MNQRQSNLINLILCEPESEHAESNTRFMMFEWQQIYNFIRILHMVGEREQEKESKRER